jgi:4-amino-4-deoxy-L-arabinose transferase-like glycosyltransferase
LKFILKKKLLLILLLALILRIVFLIFFVNLKSEFYSEFGYIAQNLIAGKGYSLFYFVGNQISQDFDMSIHLYPSAFMPPVYVYFLYPFFHIDNIVLRNILLISSQIILSLVSIVLLYKLTKKIFSEKAALIAALIAAILPEFIFITSVFNAVALYHILILCFFLVILSDDLFLKNKYILFFSIISSLLILLRSEFVFLLILVLILILLNKKFKFFINSLLLILILISPWIIRNSIIFKEFIPLTTSGGLNFYRGHNPEWIGYWGDSYFLIDARSKSDSTNFEINYSKYFFEKGFDYVKDNPGKEVINSFLKLFHLWVFNPDDKRSFNPLYLLSSISVLLFSVLGIIKSFNLRKYIYFYAFFFTSSVISVIFFALPRYQIMMKICLIPFCAFYFVYIFNLLNTRFGKR